MIRPALFASFALLVSPGAADAQGQPSSGREEFLAGVAEAAERYADRREAIYDGFRKIGPDFPGMGEHWIHTSRIVAGELQGDRPPVLCYVEIDGEPTLVGVAYTVTLSGVESPPAEPFGTEVWHDHSGQVTEESLLLNHPSSVTARDPSFRLSMVHVWMPMANPEGLLAQNNWTIPFLRAGLEPPADPEPAAARGLSLGSEGVQYYRELLYWGAGPDAAEQALIDGLLEERGAQVDAWIERARGGWAEEDLAELERVWVELWDGLERSLDADTYERIRPLRAGD